MRTADPCLYKLKKSKNRTLTASSFGEYEAPLFFVGLFYFLLAAWTAVCVILLGTKAFKYGWPLGQLFMMAFVLAYTWYFSLGIAYKIRINRGGDLELISVRRKLSVSAETIELAEGPRFTLIPYCFIRFRLVREKAYLFCRITDEPLHRVFHAIRRIKPDLKFKGLPMVF
jgi:hypothetical protein